MKKIIEFKNDSSNLKIQDNKVICENENIFNKNTSHLIIDVDNIKEFRVISWKLLAYVIYFLSFLAFLGIFQKTHVVDVSYTFSYVAPYPIEYKIIGGCMSLLLMIIGYFYNKKYGEYYSLNVKYYEGKIKSSLIYTSLDEEELNKIQNEIQNIMMRKK